MSGFVDLRISTLDKKYRKRKKLCKRCGDEFVAFSQMTLICPKCKVISKREADKKRRDNRPKSKILMRAKKYIDLVKKGDTNENT